MRELHNQEIEAVSGAGAIADTGAAIGKGIGEVLEGFGLKGASGVLAEVGNGIGQIVEIFQNVSSFLDGLFNKKPAPAPLPLPLPAPLFK